MLSMLGCCQSPAADASLQAPWVSLVWLLKSVEGVDAAGEFCSALVARCTTRLPRLGSCKRAANILWPKRQRCRSALGRAPRARPSGKFLLYSMFAPLGWGPCQNWDPPGCKNKAPQVEQPGLLQSAAADASSCRLLGLDYITLTSAEGFSTAGNVPQS